jgi:hypothetical protein
VSSWDRDAVGSQDFLGLVFVYIHEDSMGRKLQAAASIAAWLEKFKEVKCFHCRLTEKVNKKN